MKNDPENFSYQNKIEFETLLDFCLKEIGENTDKLLATLFIKALKSNALRGYLPDGDFDLFINASLELHHIQSPSQRDVFIAEMAKLKSAAFLLTEPNVNNLEPNLYKRFQNSYEHFSHVFQVIDELNIKRQEKNALKLCFGREIEDIIGKQNRERFECHDTANNWIRCLQNAGFKINKHFPYPV
ncbi:MAG: GRAS family protein [Bacteroidales bacterium]